MCILVHIISLKFTFDFFIPHLYVYVTSIIYLSINLSYIYHLSIYHLSVLLSIHPPATICLCSPTLSLLFFGDKISVPNSLHHPTSESHVWCCWDCGHEVPFPDQTSYVFNFLHFFQCLLTHNRRKYFEKAYRTL